VAIADVAHYVRAGSALDKEAKARGNSNYFPASVEPMLPEALSNDLCSLKPGFPRLVLAAQIRFNPEGEPLSREFHPALIQSRARLTYSEVHAAIALGETGETRKLAPFLPMLASAYKLAEILSARRKNQGALSFDLAETQVVLDAAGEIRELLFRKKLSSHSLIEEFMIAANEAVADHLSSLPERPAFIRRVHPAPEPEKLRALYRALSAGGLNSDSAGSSRPEYLRGLGSPADVQADLQKIISRAKGKMEEFVVNRLLLRSMAQARYSPAAAEHFGLASSSYCHFTSPIRRYADLTVHRVLRRHLGLGHKKEALPKGLELAELAEALNAAERNSVEAERDIHKICAALFLKRLHKAHPERIYPAVVAGLSSFGLYAELAEMPAEGFVPVEELAADVYHLDTDGQRLLALHGGGDYRLGQPLELLLRSANPLRGGIRFAPAGPIKKISGKKSKRAAKKREEGKAGTNRAVFPAGSVRIRNAR
jgi:ribonuclease R